MIFWVCLERINFTGIIKRKHRNRISFFTFQTCQFLLHFCNPQAGGTSRPRVRLFVSQRRASGGHTSRRIGILLVFWRIQILVHIPRAQWSYVQKNQAQCNTTRLALFWLFFVEKPIIIESKQESDRGRQVIVCLSLPVINNGRVKYYFSTILTWG